MKIQLNLSFDDNLTSNQKDSVTYAIADALLKKEYQTGSSIAPTGIKTKMGYIDNGLMVLAIDFKQKAIRLTKPGYKGTTK